MVTHEIKINKTTYGSTDLAKVIRKVVSGEYKLEKDWVETGYISSENQPITKQVAVIQYKIGDEEHKITLDFNDMFSMIVLLTEKVKICEKLRSELLKK